jgi:hypothetical protein
MYGGWRGQPRRQAGSIGGFLLVLLALVLGGCDRLTAIDTHPVGASIVDDQGQEVARFIGGGLGMIRVTVGGSSMYTVKLIDDLNGRVAVDGQVYQIVSPAILTGLRASVSFDPPDRLLVTGQQAGSTVLEFDVKHETHIEFRVTVAVEVE